MKELFYTEAKKNKVLPLDNSTLTRWNTPRPNLTEGRTVFTYSGDFTGVPASGAPDILNKAYTITADVEIPEDGAEGMIVTQGGRLWLRTIPEQRRTRLRPRQGGFLI